MSLRLNKNIDWSEALLNNNHSVFPKEWAIYCFQDVGSFKTGKDYKSVQGPTHPVYGSSSAPMAVRTSIPIYTKDSFIIGRKGTIDKPFYVKGPFWCVDTAMYFEHDASKSDIRFLYYSAKTIPWMKYNSGSTIPSLTQSLANSLAIVLPPLAEQTAIANILSDQEALIAQYDNLIALHEKRFAYLSDELLSGRLRLNVDGIASSNENWQMVSVNGDLVEIPADWETKKLGQTLTCLDSKRKPLNSKERASQKGLVPYWGANSIVDFVSGYLLDEDVVLLGEDAAPFFDKSKRVAFASHGKIWPNNHVHVLKPKDIDFSYAVYVLNQLPYEQIIGVTVRPKLTQSRMLDIDLVMPSRLEQALIAQVLSDQEALIAQYKKLRDAEKKRFDWLSDALLSGTYRVKVEA